MGIHLFLQKFTFKTSKTVVGTPIHSSTLFKFKKNKKLIKTSIIGITNHYHYHYQQLVIKVEAQMPKNSANAPM